MKLSEQQRAQTSSQPPDRLYSLVKMFSTVPGTSRNSCAARRLVAPWLLRCSPALPWDDDALFAQRASVLLRKPTIDTPGVELVFARQGLDSLSLFVLALAYLREGKHGRASERRPRAQRMRKRAAVTAFARAPSWPSPRGGRHVQVALDSLQAHQIYPKQVRVHESTHLAEPIVLVEQSEAGVPPHKCRLSRRLVLKDATGQRVHGRLGIQLPTVIGDAANTSSQIHELVVAREVPRTRHDHAKTIPRPRHREQERGRGVGLAYIYDRSACFQTVDICQGVLLQDGGAAPPHTAAAVRTRQQRYGTYVISSGSTSSSSVGRARLAASSSWAAS